jgi:hypothetical protein
MSKELIEEFFKAFREGFFQGFRDFFSVLRFIRNSLVGVFTSWTRHTKSPSKN